MEFVDHTLKPVNLGKQSRKKSCFLLDIFQKGGGGPTRIQKFWGSFFGAYFWTFSIEGGGGNPFQKFWGSFHVFFRYFLGCFEVVFGGMFFPKSA